MLEERDGRSMKEIYEMDVYRLAEGYGRYTSKDKANFYRYSRGSFEETKCWLRKASRRKLITKTEIKNYKKMIDELGPKLNAFIRSTLKSTD
jgi:four helix bundle protein